MSLMTGSASAYHIIDDFIDGGFDVALASVGSLTDSQTGLAGVIGGQRDIVMTVTTHPGGPADGRAFVDDVVNKELSFANDPGVAGVLELKYGSFADTAPGPSDLNEDFSGEIVLDLDVKEVDLNGWLTVDLDANGSLFSNTVPIPSSGGLVHVMYFGPTGFPGLTEADLADVDGIQYTFSGPTNWDVRVKLLASNETISPEPATMSLLGVGVLTLIRRRRKR
jgi:hypothetical protein